MDLSSNTLSVKDWLRAEENIDKNTPWNKINCLLSFWQKWAVHVD